MNLAMISPNTSKGWLLDDLRVQGRGTVVVKLEQKPDNAWSDRDKSVL